MARDSIDAVLDDLTAWAEKTETETRGNGDDAHLLLQLLHDHLDVEPGALGGGDLKRLLLDVYPRKVTVLDRADAADVVPTVRDLLAFLGETGRVAPRTLESLEREVDEIEPVFLDEVMNPDNWGMARSITQAMAAHDVDLEDPDAVERWIAAYNADLVGSGLPEGHEGSIFSPGIDPGIDHDDDETHLDLAEAFGLPDRLPSLRLPPRVELAALARTSPLLHRARQLGCWLGGGRDLTEDGELTAPDAIAAAGALDIEIPAEGAETVLPGMPPAPVVRDMSELPELVRLWSVAEVVGFVDAEDGDRARTGDATRDWPDGDDDDVLDVWTTAFGHMLSEALCLDAEVGEGVLDFRPVGGALVLALFLARGDGVPRVELHEAAREVATADLTPQFADQAWASWNSRYGDPVQTLLGRLGEHDAVVAEGDVARLTPLAMSAMRDQLDVGGIEIPLLPPVEEMTAADLVSVAEAGTAEELADEAAAWMALRSPEDAARELLDVAATGGAPERLTATSIVTDLGAPAEPVWRDVLDRTDLRPYAKLALSQIHGADPSAGAPGLEPEPEDIAWLLVDGLAATSSGGGAEDIAEHLRDAVPPGEEEAVFGVMWRLSHPDAPDVLAMIGKHHPDKKIAKAARKAAFRANSRR